MTTTLSLSGGADSLQIPSPSKKPAIIAFKMLILYFVPAVIAVNSASSPLRLIAERNKYTAKRPKNSPKVYDLNHPKLPL